MDEALVRAHEDGVIDARAAERLSRRGLTLRTVAHGRPEMDGWLRATYRGFLDDEPTEEKLSAGAERHAASRLIGVYDETGPLPQIPIGTFGSWVAPMSVPGGTVPTLAITDVTVAPTHAGRGIARAMMEGELRHAAGCGIPMASLTVTESSIYGRYGFASAALTTNWTIDTKRARWSGPTPAGRVDFIAPTRVRELGPLLHEKVRADRPGEIPIPPVGWDALVGAHPDVEKPASLRAVQYTSATGEPAGFAVYTVKENADDYTKSTVRIAQLLAVDADAYAGLWRFFIELPLIGRVMASELSLDEPLRWMISDQRAAQVRVWDHEYIRILDVGAVLAARRYPRAGTLLLEVDDPLQISGGRWLLEVGDDGRARAHAHDGEAVAGTPTIRLGTAELSAVYLGGVSVATLAAAGRIEATDATAAAGMLAGPAVPQLSFWY